MAGEKKRPLIQRGLTMERKQRGRVDRDVMFPVAPSDGETPPDYAAWLADLKARIHQERLHVVLAGNAIMVLLYWDLGRSILEKQADQGWGSRVIDRLAADLRQTFPEMKSFSPRNLNYMRSFAAAWPERAIVQASLAQLPWYHYIALLEKLDHRLKRQLCIEISLLGFRTSEPEGIPRETSQVLDKEFVALRREEVTKADVARDL